MPTSSVTSVGGTGKSNKIVPLFANSCWDPISALYFFFQELLLPDGETAQHNNFSKVVVKKDVIKFTGRLLLCFGTNFYSLSLNLLYFINHTFIYDNVDKCWWIFHAEIKKCYGAFLILWLMNNSKLLDLIRWTQKTGNVREQKWMHKSEQKLSGKWLGYRSSVVNLYVRNRETRREERGSLHEFFPSSLYSSASLVLLRVRRW